MAAVLIWHLKHLKTFEVLFNSHITQFDFLEIHDTQLSLLSK